jgi:putative OPT family oligopeptide transporter
LEPPKSSKVTSFQPYIAPERSLPEFTVRAVILGSVLGIIFGAANAYLGLYVGMTVSASIPAAVISMGILRGVLRRGTILENNMVQTIASTGEAVAAGVIFTIPAFFIWRAEFPDIPFPSLGKIFMIALLGGVIGILFMIPLRRALIQKEHGILTYPEGTACAEVLKAGDRGGSHATPVFLGVAGGAVYKALMTGVGLWEETVTVPIKFVRNLVVSIDPIPALLGVGYIIGPRLSAIMFLGGALSGLFLIPFFSYFGDTMTSFLHHTGGPIAAMTDGAIRSEFVRYVGVGAVAGGGILSLIKSLPTIIHSFSAGVQDLRRRKETLVQKPLRTDHDLPMPVILWGSLLVCIGVWLFTPSSLPGAVMVTIFSFFFVTVSSRIVGMVGSSSNPASGMTIATLLGTALVFVALGHTGSLGMIAVLTVGAVVCSAICNAGDISQDLKTGYLVGATPYKQQIGEVVGVLTSAPLIGLTLYLLNNAYGFVQDAAHPQPLQAPQANLMATIIKGVMQGQLPWGLILSGVGLAAIVEFLGMPSLAFAVGLYLPMSLSSGVMVGGLVKWWVDRKSKGREMADDPGILYSSGLIAGEALVGILLAVCITLGWVLGPALGWMGSLEVVGTLIIYALLTISLIAISQRAQRLT